MAMEAALALGIETEKERLEFSQGRGKRLLLVRTPFIQG
jgi:hypothetical protein